MKWQVGISGSKCNFDFLEKVLEKLGYKIAKSDNYYLSSNKFEQYTDNNIVWEEANKIKNVIRDLSTFLPVGNIAFNLEHLLEMHDDGSVNKHHFATVVVPATARLTLTGYAPTVFVGTPEEIERQRKEKEGEEKKENIRETVKLVGVAMENDKVRLVYDLLKGQLSPLIMGHVFDIIKDDIGGEVKKLATKSKITRFNRSINHPDIFGMEARHMVSQQEPPADPMNLDEAKEFIKELVNRWVEKKYEQSKYFFV